MTQGDSRILDDYIPVSWIIFKSPDTRETGIKRAWDQAWDLEEAIKWQLKSITELAREGLCQFRRGNIPAALVPPSCPSLCLCAKFLCSINRQKKKLISVSFLTPKEFLPCLLSNLSRLRGDPYSPGTMSVIYFNLLRYNQCNMVHTPVGWNFHIQKSSTNMLWGMPRPGGQVTFSQKESQPKDSYDKPHHYLQINQEQKLCQLQININKRLLLVKAMFC